MSGEKFLISTQSYRHEYDSEVEIPTQYGYLIETDFSGFFRKLEIPTKTDSPYGERIKPGLRGLCSFDGKIYVCTWNRVYIIDYDSFNVTDSFDHSLMADLHGIYVEEGGIWVTSSLIDSVLSFDWNYNLRGVLTFCNTPLYPRRERKKIDISKDYRLRGKLERGFKTSMQTTSWNTTMDIC